MRLTSENNYGSKSGHNQSLQTVQVLQNSRGNLEAPTVIKPNLTPQSPRNYSNLSIHDPRQAFVPVS